MESAYELANILSQKDRVEEAAEYYANVIKLNPKHEKAWYKLGILYVKTGELDKAQEIVIQLEKLNSDLGGSFCRVSGTADVGSPSESQRRTLSLTGRATCGARAGRGTAFAELDS